MEKFNERESYLVDIEKMLGPKLRKKLPRFAINFLKRRLHQKEVNEVIMSVEHYKGVKFFDEALNYLNITYRIRGEEHLATGTDKKYIFVCNHPLGGPEALIIGSIFHRLYGEGFQVPVTPIMANLKPLAEFFTPVNNLSSKQSRDLGAKVAGMFNSDSQVLIFPAGLCAREIDGKVTELPWKKTFITQAKKFERDIVPLHISGFNSKRYFFLPDSINPRDLTPEQFCGRAFMHGEVMTAEEYADRFNNYQLGNIHPDFGTLKMYDYTDHIVEMCPHCENEVVLDTKYCKQRCPICNRLIKPCSMCADCISPCPLGEDE